MYLLDPVMSCVLILSMNTGAYCLIPTANHRFEKLFMVIIFYSPQIGNRRKKYLYSEPRDIV